MYIDFEHCPLCAQYTELSTYHFYHGAIESFRMCRKCFCTMSQEWFDMYIKDHPNAISGTDNNKPKIDNARIVGLMVNNLKCFNGKMSNRAFLKKLQEVDGVTLSERTFYRMKNNVQDDIDLGDIDPKDFVHFVFEKSDSSPAPSKYDSSQIAKAEDLIQDEKEIIQKPERKIPQNCTMTLEEIDADVRKLEEEYPEYAPLTTKYGIPEEKLEDARKHFEWQIKVQNKDNPFISDETRYFYDDITVDRLHFFQNRYIEIYDLTFSSDEEKKEFLYDFEEKVYRYTFNIGSRYQIGTDEYLELSKIQNELAAGMHNKALVKHKGI